MRTCLNSSCPERKSLCCGAISTVAHGEENTNYFICSVCYSEFRSKECTAGPKTVQGIFDSFYLEGKITQEHAEQIKELLRNALDEASYGQEMFTRTGGPLD